MRICHIVKNLLIPFWAILQGLDEQLDVQWKTSHCEQFIDENIEIFWELLQKKNLLIVNDTAHEAQLRVASSNR